MQNIAKLEAVSGIETMKMPLDFSICENNDI